MKIKTMTTLLMGGVILGFFFGLVKGIFLVISHHYLAYRMYRLILFNLANSLNKGVIYSLILIVSACLLLIMISIIWKRLFSKYFEFRIIRRKELLPLIKAIFLALIFVYWLFQFLKFFLGPAHNTNLLLGRSLIVFCLLFVFLQILKMDFQMMKSRAIDFVQSAAVKKATVIIILFMGAINLLNVSQKLFNRPSGPNVLLIVADALRADHLGCYGYNRPASPQIDKFATESLVFEKALSNSPWTKPSIGTIFTSLYPHEHRAFYWSDNLRNECLTLAEVFRDRNYSTFAIQTNPSITKKHNFKQGFQYYEEIVLENGEKVTNKFTTWLKKNKKKPFFAYLHFMDTHSPYNAPHEFSQIFGIKKDSLLNPGEFKTIDIRLLTEMGLSSEDKKHLITLYDGAIKYLDYNFKVIMDNLKKLEIADMTIILLTADHGEEFWDHDGFAHGHTLYRELLHVPLIIRYPPLFKAERIKFYVPLLDLFPTILSMAGIRNTFDLKGKDLRAVIHNKSSVNCEIYCEGLLDGAEKKAIIKDGWKLIENTGIKNKDTFHLLGELTKYKYPEYKNGFELYNIKHDFPETYNQIDNFPQIAAKLKGYLKLFKMFPVDYRKRRSDSRQKKFDDLKSLGYIK